MTIEDLRLEFGDRIASLVAQESEERHEGMNDEESWHNRKRISIERLAKAPHDAKIVALADKLSNIRAIARDSAEMGDALWERFHSKDPKDHEWHYRGLADSLGELQDTAAFQEFESLINKVFSHGSY